MKYILILFVFLSSVGCNTSGRPEKPEDLIPEDQMTNILYDVFILNSAKGINKKILENHGVLPQDYVFKKYHIDSLQFALSNNYYAYNTKTYQGILNKVTERLKVQKKEYDSIVEQDRKVADSLMRLKKQQNLDSLKKYQKTLKSDSIVRKYPIIRN